MDKEELINDIETIERMIESQLQLIEQLQQEVRKGQLVLEQLKRLNHEESHEEEINIEEFGGGLFG